MNGVRVDAPAVRYDPQSFQSSLREAKERYGSALCDCGPRPLRLVIRERNGKLFLAAWPDQAAEHSLDCPFYSDHRESAGRYAPGTIEREGDLTSLSLAQPLLRASRHRPSQDARQNAPVVAAAPEPKPAQKSAMQLWGLLHYLWEEAALNRWYPGWHRDWGLVRYMLRRVAQNTMVRDKPLLESLYVPPVWNPKKKSEIEDHWRQFTAPLLQNNRRQETVATGLVIGTIRSLEVSEYGHVIQLHHHSARFYMDQRISDNAAQYSRRGWNAAKQLEAVPDEGSKPYVVAAMRVESTGNGRLVVVEAVLMRVSPRFIPVNSPYEDRLARHLIECHRQFVRPLHYDSHTQALPDFVLKDTVEQAQGGQVKPTSVALYIYGPAITPQLKPRLQAADRQYAKGAGLGFWQWDVAQQPEMPALPPPALPAARHDGELKRQSKGAAGPVAPHQLAA